MLSRVTNSAIRLSRPFADATALIVVVSASALRSKWVAFEVTAFQTHHRNRKVVALRLDDTEPRVLHEPLGSLQYVDFRPSKTAAFDDLLRFFGKQFLVEPNKVTERRGRDRRTRQENGADRRQSPLVARLRKGFWLAFYRETEPEKHDEFRLNPYTLDKVVRGLLVEATRYKFVRRSTGGMIPPRVILQAATKHVWQIMRDWENLSTVNVIEAVADQICADYDVSTRQRRAAGRRVEVGKVMGV